MAYKGTTQKLNTGAAIPAIGFGTWNDKEAQEGAVATALKVGYRHIDTAHVYGTEPAVARGIKKSGVPREEIFLVTKIWNNYHENVEKGINASLANLETDYVDLLLMHWPSPFQEGDELFPRDDAGKIIPGKADYLDTWKKMVEVHKTGKARAIGVSNFSQAEMERLLANTDVVPAVHQLELHPYLQQQAFCDWHKSKGIHLTHYSPFGNSNPTYDKGKEMAPIIENEALTTIGKKYNKSGAQVALAWGIARGHSVIPKSKTEHRIKQNLEGDFQLECDDIAAIGKLDKKIRFNNPSKGFGWKFYADLEGQ